MKIVLFLLTPRGGDWGLAATGAAEGLSRAAPTRQHWGHHKEKGSAGPDQPKG